MSSLRGCLVLFAALVLMLGHEAWGEPPAGEQKPLADAKKTVRTDLYGDPLPPGAIARLGTIRLQHGDGIGCLAFSPNCKILASGGGQSIRLWDVATGKCLRQISLEGSYRPVCCIAFSPDGKSLAAGTGDKVFFWDVGTGQPIPKEEKAIYANCLAFSPDGKLLASGYSSGVFVWDVPTGKRQATWKGHTTSVTHVLFSPDGKVLASASEGSNTDDAVRLWEVPTGNELHKFSVDHEGVVGVVFSPDGKTLVSAARRKVIRRWDVTTGKLEKQVPGGDWLSLLGPGGALMIATDHTNAKMQVWDVGGAKELFKLEGQETKISCAVFSRDGKLLASASYGGAIRLWDLTRAKEMFRYSRFELPFKSLAYSTDGQTLITGSSRVIRFWDATSAKMLRDIRGEGEDFTVTSDGTTLAWNSVLRGITLWDVAGGKELGKVEREPEICYRAAISPDGTQVASVPYRLQRINLWDAATGQLLHQIKGEIGNVNSLVYSANGKVLAAQYGRTIHLWEAATGREIRKIVASPEDQKTSTIGPVVLSPNGKSVISAGKSIDLWDIASGKNVLRIPRQASVIALSPDGTLLASSGHDQPGMLSLWELATGEEIVRLAGHENSVCSIAFGPGVKTLASAGTDNTVLIWDMLTLPGLEPKSTAQALNPTERDTVWGDLAGKDIRAAYRAIGSILLSTPKEGAGLIKDRLKPAPLKDVQQIRRLLADLDSDQFAARETASQELEKLGSLVEPELANALQGNPSLEARKRLEDLLDALQRHPPPPERLRQIRAIRVLEQIGSAEARQVLESLARGEPAASQTRDALAALERLNRRGRDR